MTYEIHSINLDHTVENIFLVGLYSSFTLLMDILMKALGLGTVKTGNFRWRETLVPKLFYFCTCYYLKQWWCDFLKNRKLLATKENSLWCKQSNGLYNVKLVLKILKTHVYMGDTDSSENCGLLG